MESLRPVKSVEVVEIVEAIEVAEVVDVENIFNKGLSNNSVGLIGAVVIGISCVAPAYTLTSALGPTVSAVGLQLPVIFLMGFIPMLLVAFGYRELNSEMPDSGTSFTWVSRAFGPWLGFMAGWGLIAATIIVLSNLAAVAVDFFYLLISQIFNKNSEIAALSRNIYVNIFTCLAFISTATYISYRDMQTTQKFQYALVGFQMVILILFALAVFFHINTGNVINYTPVSIDWFNPLKLGSFSAFAAGLSLSIFIFWGWDVTLTMSEETKGSRSTPGLAAGLTVLIIVVIYLLVAVAVVSFAGIGETGIGLNNPAIQENVFAVLAAPILKNFALLLFIAVLFSSAASLQSTFVGPARTLLAMGHYGALPKKFAHINPRFFTPSYATFISAIVAATFYTAMRIISENVLWDTITALGMMICFYYGLTAFACVWYFRKRWFSSFRNTIFLFISPLLGGIILGSLFFKTLIDSMDPSYGSGSSLFGIGLVFILGMVIFGLGIIVMIWMSYLYPDFFKGKTLAKSFAK